MDQSIYIKDKVKIPSIGKIPLYFVIVTLVFLLAVLQDYLYSKIQHTGFYLSESLLYNTFWAFFIPLTIFINRLIKIVNPKSKLLKLPLNLAIGAISSFLHLLLFTALFVSVSNIVFSPPHRFSSIFYTAFSNQFYLVVLWYVIFPIIYNSIPKAKSLTTNFPEKIKLKVGSKLISIPTANIQLIATDKPYSVVYAKGQKMLDNKSLKEFETKLDSSIFLRVHRSTIINTAYIKELKSRSNGDYDAKLENGETVRLSRHYRSNWQQLLQ